MDVSWRTAEAQISDYYLNPLTSGGGGGPNYVEGTIFSKGRGFGSLLRGVAKTVAPFIKSAARKIAPFAKKAGKYVLKQGLNTVADTASDMLEGASAIDAFKNNSEATLENMRYDGLRKVANLRRTPSSKTKPGKKRRRKRPLDNFD